LPYRVLFLHPNRSKKKKGKWGKKEEKRTKKKNKKKGQDPVYDLSFSSTPFVRVDIDQGGEREEGGGKGGKEVSPCAAPRSKKGRHDQSFCSLISNIPRSEENKRSRRGKEERGYHPSAEF